MKCFTHSSDAAIAICKFCGRGVCHNCARESGAAIACSDACAAEALEAKEMQRRAKRLYGIGEVGRRFPMSAVSLGSVGLLFLVWAGIGYARWGVIDWSLVAAAVVFLALSIMAYRRVRDLQLNY